MATVFAHHAGHCHGFAPESVAPSRRAHAAKYSWKLRCDACSCIGSACSRLSSGCGEIAVRSPGLALGYQGHADATRHAFVTTSAGAVVEGGALPTCRTELSTFAAWTPFSALARRLLARASCRLVVVCSSIALPKAH